MIRQQASGADLRACACRTRRQVLGTVVGAAAGALSIEGLAKRKHHKGHKGHKHHKKHKPKKPRCLTCEKKGSSVFVVTDDAFGAVGDGVTPDADAIQAAIDTASPVKGTVCFPQGTYLLEKPLELKPNVSLVAACRRTATLKCEPDGAEPVDTGFEMLHGVDASDVTISGLVIASTRDAHAAGSALVCFTGPNSPIIDDMHTVSKVRVFDCEISGFKKRGVRTAARRIPGQGQFRNVEVTGCHIHHLGLMDDPEAFGLGIQPNGCDGVTIKDNDLHDIGQIHQHWGIYASDSRAVMIRHNTFRRCAGGIAIAGDTMLDKIEIYDNQIEDATSDAHIGMQLIGGAHCIVSRNELTGAIIQPGTGRSPSGDPSRIEDNTIDLNQLGLSERGAIFIGTGVATTGLVIQRNVIRNGVDDDFARADRGIRLGSGSDITLSKNKISGMYTGIHAFAKTDLDPANEPMRNLVVDGNAISGGARANGARYISLTNVRQVTVRDNTGEGGTPWFGISLGGDFTEGVSVLGNQVGPGPTIGPLQVPDTWASRSDIDIAPFVEIEPGVWAE